MDDLAVFIANRHRQRYHFDVDGDGRGSILSLHPGDNSRESNHRGYGGIDNRSPQE
jgi:hypothetical protein